MLLSQSVRVVGVVRVVSEICFLISTSAAMPPWISFFKFFKNTPTHPYRLYTLNRFRF